MSDADRLPGTTRPAGEDVSDEQFSSQVVGQTDSDLEVQAAFQREAHGAATDAEIAKATGDELAG